MAGPQARVLVLYRHSLLGKGLAELLAREATLDVTSVDEDDPDALRAALAGRPDVILFEEGGAVEPLDLLRQSGCPVLIDVSLATSEAWEIRRDAITRLPDRLVETVLAATRRHADGLVRS